MKHFQILSLATIVVLSIAPVIAQGQPAPVPPTAAAKPVDCGKTTMKRHDHAAERGGGVVMAFHRGLAAVHRFGRRCRWYGAGWP